MCLSWAVVGMDVLKSLLSGGSCSSQVRRLCLMTSSVWYVLSQFGDVFDWLCLILGFGAWRGSGMSAVGIGRGVAVHVGDQMARPLQLRCGGRGL